MANDKATPQKLRATVIDIHWFRDDHGNAVPALKELLKGHHSFVYEQVKTLKFHLNIINKKSQALTGVIRHNFTSDFKVSMEQLEQFY